MTTALDSAPTGLSEDQIEFRHSGVGASEAWDIVEMRWYRIWLRKQGLEPTQEDSADAEFGRRFEGTVRAWYADKMKVEVLHGQTFAMPGHPRVLATPDGLVYAQPHTALQLMEGQGASRVVEVKCPRHGDDWGPDGSTQIPDRYWWQVQAQMAVTGAPEAHLVALIYREMRVYPIARNQAAIDGLVSEIEHFWETYMDGDTPPPVDGTDECHGHLSQRFPRSAERVWLEDGACPVDVAAIARAHERAARAEKDAALEKSAHRAQLKELVGTAYGARGPWGRVCWTAVKGASRVDYPAAVMDLLRQFGIEGRSAQEHLEALVAKHTGRAAPHDQMRVTLHPEEDPQ